MTCPFEGSFGLENLSPNVFFAYYVKAFSAAPLGLPYWVFWPGILYPETTGSG